MLKMHAFLLYLKFLKMNISISP